MASFHDEVAAALGRSTFAGYRTIAAIVDRQFGGRNADLARALGVTPRTVQRWRAHEAGRSGGRSPAGSLARARAMSRSRATANRLRQRGATVTGTAAVTVSVDTTRRRFSIHVPGRAFRRLGPAFDAGRYDELSPLLDPAGRLVEPGAFERAAWDAYGLGRGAAFADEDGYPSSIDGFGFEVGGSSSGDFTRSG